MRKPYRTHTEGRFRGLLRSLLLKRRQPPAGASGELLVGRPDTESTLTYGEEGDLQTARAAMDSIEGRHNSIAAKGLARLAATAPALEHAAMDRRRRQHVETSATAQRDSYQSRLHALGRRGSRLSCPSAGRRFPPRAAAGPMPTFARGRRQFPRHRWSRPRGQNS